MMTKGLTRKLVLLLILLPLTAIAAGEIYRVVDENGNVTYTDQKPAGGGEVVDLPPLSVIETDIQVPDNAADAARAAPAIPGFSHHPAPKRGNVLGDGQHGGGFLGQYPGDSARDERRPVRRRGTP